MTHLVLIAETPHRKVYRHKNYVIKVAVSDKGYNDNYMEAFRYTKWRKEKTYGACKLLKSGHLVMEYLEPITSLENLPGWTDFIDCRQVGYNKKGILRAYDYAD